MNYIDVYFQVYHTEFFHLHWEKDFKRSNTPLLLRQKRVYISTSIHIYSSQMLSGQYCYSDFLMHEKEELHSQDLGQCGKYS